MNAPPLPTRAPQHVPPSVPPASTAANEVIAAEVVESAALPLPLAKAHERKDVPKWKGLPQTGDAPSVSGVPEIVPKEKKSIDVKPSRAPTVIALVAAGLLALSIPMKWEEIYAGQEASFKTSGWIILLEVLGMGICALAQFGAKTKGEAATMAKPIAGLAGFVFLFATYTLLTNLSVGSSSVAGIESGVRTGPGVWLAIVAGAIGALSQAPFLATLEEKTKKPEDKLTLV